MGLEVLGVPQFPDKFSKPGHQEEALVSWGSYDRIVIVLIQKIVPISPNE